MILLSPQGMLLPCAIYLHHATVVTWSAMLIIWLQKLFRIYVSRQELAVSSLLLLHYSIYNQSVLYLGSRNQITFDELEGFQPDNNMFVDWFPWCFFRMVPRLKDRVKPNRRAHGSSDCGIPSIISILPVLSSEGSSLWLCFPYCSQDLCLYCLTLNVRVTYTHLFLFRLAAKKSSPKNAAHPPVVSHSARQWPPQVADCLAAFELCSCGKISPWWHVLTCSWTSSPRAAGAEVNMHEAGLCCGDFWSEDGSGRKCSNVNTTPGTTSRTQGGFFSTV